MELCKIFGLDLDWTCDFSKYSVIRSMAMDRIYLNYIYMQVFLSFYLFQSIQNFFRHLASSCECESSQTVKFGIKVSDRVKLIRVMEIPEERQELLQISCEHTLQCNERCLTSLSESFLKQSHVWNHRVLERTHQRDKESLHIDNSHHVIHL